MGHCNIGICSICSIHRIDGYSFRKARAQKFVAGNAPLQGLKKLRSGGIVVEEYKMLTIFVSDIVGFTSMAAKMSPIDVMKMLNSF